MNSVARMSPLIQLRSIHKAFGGVRAVEDVSLTVHPGEVVALLGHNGAGKSTLMKMLAGAYPIDSGAVHVQGQSVKITNPADSQHLASVGGVMQGAQRFFLYPELVAAILTIFGFLFLLADTASTIAVHALDPRLRVEVLEPSRA